MFLVAINSWPSRIITTWQFNSVSWNLLQLGFLQQPGGAVLWRNSPVHSCNVIWYESILSVLIMNYQYWDLQNEKDCLWFSACYCAATIWKTQNIKENPPNSKLLNKQAPFKRGKNILVLVSVATFGFPWYCIKMETSDTAQQQLYAASFTLTKILTRNSLLFPFCQSKLWKVLLHRKTRNVVGLPRNGMGQKKNAWKRFLNRRGGVGGKKKYC